MGRRQSDESPVDGSGAGCPAAPEERAAGTGVEARDGATSTPAPPDRTLSWADQIASWRELLPQERLDGLSDEDRLALLRELELLSRAVAAVGASLQVAFYTSQVAAQIADGVAPSRAGKAVPDDLAQARLTSPYWGSRELTCAKALVREMPRTLGALRAGVITALQARVITEATTCVDAADRAEIDERLGPRLAGASTQEIGALVRSLVYEVDPAGFVARARKAAADRGVSVRPCPDVMGLLSARLPAPQAIACYHSLRATAETMKASGDPRTLGQLMADALFERLTGRSVVDGVDVEVGLVITDEALFAGTSDAAVLLGYGPIPAQSARDLLNPTTDTSDADTSQADRSEAGTGLADDAAEGDENVGGTAHSPASTRAAPSISAGFGGGIVPAGYCPGGPRCTTFSCTLTHGHPAASGLPTAPDLGSLSRRAEPASTFTSPTTSASAADSEEPDPSALGDSCAHQGSKPERDPAAGPGCNPELEQKRPESTGERPNDPAREQRRQVAVPEAAPSATVWVRRLYTDPVSGVLTDRDNRKRLFTGALRALLVSRDQTCRNSWCGAPVRHIDHVQRHADQGSTDAENGRGLCARCNLARERPRQLGTPPSTYRPPPPLLPCLPRPEHRAAA
ncbi:DUF222 domain-containing protein [Ornithinimicrobium pratense]|uniref:HNH endonuclease signature motif containing protein n=1 Tax=Ornithinimicrobium pratense TaxID=2593973 RepID=UPI0017884608|nr:DUF222 domain-containing protein [Ornithinimicrobium pratense]